MSVTSKSSSSYRETDVIAPTDIKVGVMLPEIERTVSRLHLAMYCASIRFVHQVHFDDELCRTQGWNGVILPGFLMGNWCLESVTRMLGPRSLITSISFKMASVAYPDTPLRIRGEVTDVSADDGVLIVTCAMIVVDKDETTVTKATVKARVPIA